MDFDPNCMEVTKDYVQKSLSNLASRVKNSHVKYGSDKSGFDPP